MFILKKMSPQLPVSNLRRSVDFYLNTLGFALDFVYEGFYAGVIKDGHSIHMKAADHFRDRNGQKEDLDITFSVDAIETLFEDLKSKSVNIVQPLRVMPYGTEFYIDDPDGNRLAFLRERE